MFFVRLTSKSFALLACTALLLSTHGCNMGSVIAPERGEPQIIENPSFIRILSAPKGTLLTEGAQRITKLVTAENGGIVTNGWITLEFSPGALAKDAEISINMLDPSMLRVELEPHGIRFNEQVVMTIDLTGTTAEGKASETSTIWYNEKSDQWERIQSLSAVSSNQARASLEHFSHFGQVPQG